MSNDLYGTTPEERNDPSIGYNSQVPRGVLSGKTDLTPGATYLLCSLKETCERQNLSGLSPLQVYKHIVSAQKAIEKQGNNNPSQNAILEYALNDIRRAELIRRRYRDRHVGNALSILLDIDSKFMLPCGLDEHGRRLCWLNLSDKLWNWLKEGNPKEKQDIFGAACLEILDLSSVTLEEARKGILLIPNLVLRSQRNLYHLFSLARQSSVVLSPCLGTCIEGILCLATEPFLGVVSTMILRMLPIEVRSIASFASNLHDPKAKVHGISPSQLHSDIGGTLNFDVREYVRSRSVLLDKSNKQIFI